LGESKAALTRALEERGERDHPHAEQLMPPRLAHRCAARRAAEAAPTAKPEQACLQIGQRFKGRLKARAHVWRQMGAGKQVMQWINHGYSIRWAPKKMKCKNGPAGLRACDRYAMNDNKGCELHRSGAALMRPITLPPRTVAARNHGGARTFQKWLKAAIKELEEHGSIVRCSARRPAKKVMPLNVIPKSCNRRFRLCHDLKGLNDYVRPEQVKFETLARSRAMFKKGMHACAVDLSSSYYHLDISEESQDWLAFTFEGQTYRFCSLPFGLASAVAAFTKLMAVLTRRWRRDFKIPLVQYLDDGMTVAFGAAKAERQAQRMVQDLEAAGFVVNYEKSDLTASQCLKFLGSYVCFETGKFFAPRKRLEKLEASILAASVEHPTSRMLAAVAGQVVSLAEARGLKPAMLFTRELYAATAAACRGDLPWDTPLASVPEGVRSELAFWFKTRWHEGGLPFDDPPFCPNKEFFVDASDSKIGGYLARSRGVPLLRVALPRALVGASSTARELWGVLVLLRAFGKAGVIAEGDALLIGTDSQCSAWGLEKGASPTKANHALIKEIYITAARLKVDLRVFWHPRETEEAVEADRISKLADVHGWRLSWGDWEAATSAFGEPEVDGFATSGNRRCQAYVSRWIEPEAEACNAFHQNLGDGRHWYLCPPLHLAEQTVRQLFLQKGRATLVVPEATASAWWTLLLPFAAERLRIRDAPDPAGGGEEHADNAARARLVVLYVDAARC
jgi:hypothetical protein